MKKCKKHPDYNATTPPTNQCWQCWQIWNWKGRVKDGEQGTGCNYSTNSIKVRK